MFHDLVALFSGRELAVAVWLLIITIYCFLHHEIRPSLIALIKAACAIKLLIAFVLMSLYVFSSVCILAILKIWNTDQIKGTLLWFMFSGVSLFINTADKRNNNQFKDIIKDNVTALLVLEYISFFYSFSFLAEIILVPIVTFISLVFFYSKKKEEYRPATIISNYLLTAIGLLIFINSMIGICVSPDEFFSFTSLREFLLPISLTITFIPFMYCSALIMAYERCNVPIKMCTEDKVVRRYFLRKMLLSFNWNLNSLCRWNQIIARTHISSMNDIDHLFEELKISDDFNQIEVIKKCCSCLDDMGWIQMDGADNQIHYLDALAHIKKLSPIPFLIIYWRTT